MNILYIIYQIFIALPILLVTTILTTTTITIGCWLGDGHFWSYYPGRIWSKIFCFVLLLPVKVTANDKVKKDTSYVFVANHQGAFDIFLIYGYLDRNFKWMMKKGIRKIPLVGKACETSKHIFVDKSGPKKIKETIDKARAILQNGTSLVVFPEGARSFTGHMGYFKKGAFLLADELQLPVVPMSIIGSFQILPRTGKILHWHPLELVIHDPIYPVGKGPENIQYLMEKSYQAIEKGMCPEEQGMIKNPDQ